MFDSYNKAITDIIRKYTEPNDAFSGFARGSAPQFAYQRRVRILSGRPQATGTENLRLLRRLYPREEFNNPSVEYFVRQQLREELKNITAAKAGKWLR